MMRTSILLLAGIALSTLAASAADKWDISKVDVAKLPPASDKKDVTYANDILPIFKTSCLRCHGDRQQKGDLRLDSLDAVLHGGKDGKVVVANDSKKSLLVAAAAQVSDDIAMPPKRGPRGPGGPGPGNGPPGSPNGGGRPPGGPDDGGRPPGGPGYGNGPDDGPGGSGGPGGPNGPRGFGPGGPPKPLTPSQVGLIRAWIDQGAK
jgi:hypothetical protein